MIVSIILSQLSFAQKQPNLITVTDSDSIDFGKVVAGPAYRIQVELKNRSNEIILLEEWQTACPCLTIEYFPSEIPPQSSLNLTIVLKTEAVDRGYYGSSVYILSDDPIRPILRIPIKVIWTDPFGNTTPTEKEAKEFLDYGASQDFSPQQDFSKQITATRQQNAIDLMNNPKMDSLLNTLPSDIRNQWKSTLQSLSQQQVPVPVKDSVKEIPLLTPTGEINWQSGELTPRMFDSLTAVLSGLEWIPPEVEESEWVQQVQSPVFLEIFHSFTCRECRKAVEILEPIIQSYGGRVLLKYYSTDTDSGLARLIDFQKLRRVKADPFLLIIGSQTVTNLNQLDSLKPWIDELLNTREQGVIPYATNIEALKQTFTSLTFWTLISAGLIDGINPCAFATIIFFVSLLTYIGGKRKEILTVGITFSITVFITYLLLGLGAFGILTQLKTYQILSEIIYILTSILLLLLIILSFRDLWSWLNNAPSSESILQLPASIKRKIHKTMKDNLSKRHLVVGSIVIGFFVSLFESVCTGQVYLPTIVMLLKDPILAGQAWMYLIIYNVMFVAPLWVVFLLAYNGISSNRIAHWSKKNYGWIKFALLGLFVLLFIIMIGEIFG